jgi:hypothetical protein
MRNGLAVRSEEQAKKVAKIFPTNELALLNTYPNNNKKTVYISEPLVNCNFYNAPLLP